MRECILQELKELLQLFLIIRKILTNSPLRLLIVIHLSLELFANKFDVLPKNAKETLFMMRYSLIRIKGFEQV